MRGPVGGDMPVAAAALAPVADSLLRKAKRDAARIRKEARTEADALIGQARREAAQILAEARDAGTSEATASTGEERVRARRRARSIVLAARRKAYEEVCRKVRSAMASLCEENPQTTKRLRTLARDRAGDDARITTTPDGGVVAVAPDRRVECSLSALADHAVRLLGAEVERLWES